MRIAISGTHFSGKSSIVSSMVKQLPGYVSIDEPYYLLEEDGYVFPEPPTVEDFEQQMIRSVKTINESSENTIFDRCPLDPLAYALAMENTSPLEEPVDTNYWIDRMEDAMELIDLLVFVPIEDKDRILVPSSQDLKLRRYVDEKLYEFIVEDSLGILGDIEIIEVSGSIENRVKMLLR
ncbi:MAG: hypothetical protein S4CHLAM37_04400 [Chlamydiia bacterium]|nr:hypothetical protein [Chlamydiia bacterium]